MRIAVMWFIVSVLSGWAWSPTAIANDDPPPAPAAPSGDFQAYPDEPAVTYHTTTIDGQAVHYQATAGTITMVGRGPDYESEAKIFYIAYRRMNISPEAVRARIEEGAFDPDEVFPDAEQRPLTFSFNGGPGSSSVWLHLGVFGPKKTRYADDAGRAGPPPYRVETNPHSLIGVSDFVFIDPVSTGFSRAQGDTSARQFHGLEQDVASVAGFIKRYITTTERWSSPMFVAGESYGTTRASALADHLHNSHGISVSGVILVSAVLNFQTIRFGVGNDLPFAMFLPTYAAAAHHHDKLTNRLQRLSPKELYDRASDFALGEYTAALMQGDRLPADRKREIAQRMSEFIGLDADYIESANLRVSQSRFGKELLRDEGKTIGRFDARFTGRDRDDVGERYEYDASYAEIRANFTHSLNAYVREELGFESDLSYEVLTGVGPWDYGRAGSARYVNVADRLRRVMSQQPHIRVFLANGFHDLATPPLGADYTISTMMLRPEIRGNVRTEYYYGGHMMYLMREQLARLSADLQDYYADALAGE